MSNEAWRGGHFGATSNLGSLQKQQGDRYNCDRVPTWHMALIDLVLPEDANTLRGHAQYESASR